ncbi:MAG: hypothetical protein NTY98_21955 [Verrucomicrobia bacterium]|nr:hypothetical protein [Verrucomicrobiota bacterium]
MKPIPAIVSELLDHASSGIVGPVLAEAGFGTHPRDRVVCVKLLSWWRRPSLRQCPRPQLDLHAEHPWCQRLIELTAASPALREVADIDGTACRWSSQQTQDDQRLIHEWVREHYHPRLMTKAV